MFRDSRNYSQPGQGLPGSFPISEKFTVYRGVIPKALALIFAVCLISTLLPGRPADAAVSGQCANCHTMHNSQNGAELDSDGPYTALLTGDCVGCHSTNDAATGIDPTTGAPIVYNIGGAPAYGPGGIGLAGGNFYWVAQGDDAKGHNVFSDNPDDALSEAPGKRGGSGGCGTNSCHDNLHGVNTEFGTRQGCTKCHMMGNSDGPKGYHHKDDTGPIIDTAGEGWFRFLAGHKSGAGHGVKGIEDDDWLFTSSASDHNEYLGSDAGLDSYGGFSHVGDTMTAYCTGCHEDIHIETSGGNWIRHPSDAVIPNSGEYAAAYGAVGGVGVYDPAVPISRASLTTVSSVVTLGSDMVMCLSCHKAHGSPYDDMLRWDYAEMIAGNPAKTGGCFTCHTAKND